VPAARIEASRNWPAAPRRKGRFAQRVSLPKRDEIGAVVRRG
jgi:hypothetical protein